MIPWEHRKITNHTKCVFPRTASLIFKGFRNLPVSNLPPFQDLVLKMKAEWIPVANPLTMWRPDSTLDWGFCKRCSSEVCCFLVLIHRRGHFFLERENSVLNHWRENKMDKILNKLTKDISLSFEPSMGYSDIHLSMFQRNVESTIDNFCFSAHLPK